MAKRIFTSAKTRSAEPVPMPDVKMPAAAHTRPKAVPVSDEAIRLAAYYKWEAAGRPPGDGRKFWAEAELELRTGAVEA